MSEVGGELKGSATQHVNLLEKMIACSQNGVPVASTIVTPAQLELCRFLCRFFGRRVAALELHALFAGVREAPRHEIAGAVGGCFRQSYGELAAPGRAPVTAERRHQTDMLLSPAGFDHGSRCGERRIGRLHTGMVLRSRRCRTGDRSRGGLSDRSWRAGGAAAGS